MIEGVIFDMDGVLVDNVRYHVRAWKQLGLELGKTLTDDAIKRVFGQRNREIIDSLIGASSFTQEELCRHAAHKEELYRGFIKPELKPVTGLVAFLIDLRKEGIKAAVATSGPRDNVAMVLDGLNIRSFFEAVITGADVSRSKPDPEIFLLAARSLNLAPERCVVFEDSTSGIESARRANCRCIALATTHPPEELQLHHAGSIIRDFSGLSATAIRLMQVRSETP
jgi:beta-phosphoglucomutase